MEDSLGQREGHAVRNKKAAGLQTFNSCKTPNCIENSTISPADARRSCNPLYVFECHHLAVRMVGIREQLCLRVRVSMLIRSVEQYSILS